MGSNVPPITPILRRALAKFISLVTVDNNMISGRGIDAVAIYPEWRYHDVMTTVPDRARVRLTGISSRAYEHPADRSALVALRKLSGFDVLLRKLFGLFNERALRLSYLAGSVRVSERQFPEIYALVRDGSYILDLPDVPEVFVTQSPIVNAMALGKDRPFIVVTTGLVNLNDQEELRFVIGHELGHVLSGHAVYRTMLLYLINLAQRIAWMPIGYLGIKAIVWGLEEWFRKSELSCDRAGLLACQDVDAARRALMKLAGGPQLSELNPDAFREQAHEYDAVPDLRDSFLKLMQLQGVTHPFAVVRFAELDHWAVSGDYERILGGDYPRRDSDSDASMGEEIRNAAKSYTDSWSRSEDPLAGVLRGFAETASRAGAGIFDRFGNRGGGSSNSSDD
jgi:Zn-dependent protease with chaperone function